MPASSKPFYVTTAIPYVNAPPHVGFALELVLADSLARYQRQRGRRVRFLTGTDENSLKNVKAAEARGISTPALVAEVAGAFQRLGDALHTSSDDFIRTSVDPRHAPAVHRLWRECERSGDIYRGSYEGLYCVDCEQFYAADELLDGRCPEHETPPERVEEENWFFRLSRYGAALERLLDGGQLQLLPETRRAEMLAVIRAGLRDISISRSRTRARGWGVPVPGDPDQVVYVWFDALGNYVSALGYGGTDALYRQYWEGGERVHVIGKGITRFHAIYWPAILLSAGLPLPSSILVHGYVTLEGAKISKSGGNAVDPFEIVREFGADALRYYLLRCIRSTEDGDFSLERLAEVYEADLAGQLGNLLNRTLRMIEQYAGGRIPSPGDAPRDGDTLREVAAGLPDRIEARVQRFHLHEALAEIWKLVAEANRRVERSAPWALDRRRRDSPDSAERRAAQVELDATLYALAETLRLVAYHLEPFLPTTAARITSQLGLGAQLEERCDPLRWGQVVPGTPVAPQQVLFPRL